MIKFEEHEGKLFRMLDEPEPLTPDAEMPCLVRLIQDDSPMGKLNKDLLAYDSKGFTPKICTEVIDVNDLSDHNRGSIRYDGFVSCQYYHYELIGTSVVEGSREWALWKILNGEMVHRSGFPYKALNGEIYCTNSAGEIYPATSYQLWLENKAKDGWKIYEEPEPQYKVGDWVDCKDHAGVHAQCKVLEIHKHNVILGCKTGHRWSLPHNNIIRKLSHSEVIVRIGCLSGIIEDLSYAEDGRFWFIGGKTERCPVGMFALLYDEMLDTPTRKIVENLINAQEEKMTTWKCSDCENKLYEPKTVLYRAGRIGNGSENWEENEYIEVCPVCGSSEIYEAHFCDDCEKEVCEGERNEDDLCAECSAKAAAYDEMVDRVKDALSTPIDMIQIAKQIITKPKGE